MHFKRSFVKRHNLIRNTKHSLCLVFLVKFCRKLSICLDCALMKLNFARVKFLQTKKFPFIWLSLAQLCLSETKFCLNKILKACILRPKFFLQFPLSASKIFLQTKGKEGPKKKRKNIRSYTLWIKGGLLYRAS